MKIDFDDDDFGGFTVTEGTLKQVPYGWKEVSPGRFEPEWPQCRYRRLSVQSIKGRPNMIPFCFLFQKAVTFDQCAGCERHKPPYEYLEMTPEIAEAIKQGLPDSALIGLGLKPVKETDPVFLREFPQAKPIPWLPCKHRYEHHGQDDCCLKQYCGNSECSKHEKKVRKRICKKCEHREE